MLVTIDLCCFGVKQNFLIFLATLCFLIIFVGDVNKGFYVVALVVIVSDNWLKMRLNRIDAAFEGYL